MSGLAGMAGMAGMSGMADMAGIDSINCKLAQSPARLFRTLEKRRSRETFLAATHSESLAAWA